MAEGPQAVREAVAAHVSATAPVVLELFATPDAAHRLAVDLGLAAAAGITTTLVPPDVIAGMTDTVAPQGLLAVCSTVDRPLPEVLDGPAAGGAPTLVALLAHVRDPGNAGTVLRAADAAGAGAVVLSSGSVDVHNPKCVRSTAGSIFHLPVAQGVDVAEAVTAVRARGLVVLAADGDGDLDLDDLLDDADAARHAAGRGGADGATSRDRPALLSGPTAWLFGNEAWGLAREHRELADAVVRVPIHGRAESLNLATAATVCLYASARAQRFDAARGERR